MENFALEFFLDGSLAGSYWAHLIGWWEASVGEDVLALSFEGMQQDPERTIERVARFAGLPLSESLKAVTLRHSSIEFMREHAGQFDDHLVRNARDAACGIPTGGTSAKVRAGKVGTGRGALSAQIRDALDDRWRDEVLPQTGLSDYGAMRMYLDAGPASRTGARVG